MSDPPRRDRRSAVKREQILQAALAAFLADGYERVSVDAIAEAAGVGKQTVYSHFGGKEGLFLEAVRRARAPGAVGTATGPATATVDVDITDPGADLAHAVEQVLVKVLSPTLAALHRLTIAELPHHQQLQTMWRDDQRFAEQDHIADYLGRCHDQGVLAVADPVLAARQLVLLAVTEGRIATLYGTRALDPEERRHIAESSAALIVAAHRPPP